MDFVVLTDHRVKIKESEKIGNYLDLARELKKLWNKKVMMIAIVVGTLRIISKGQEKRLGELEIREGIKTIQTTALFRKVLETYYLSHFSKFGMKN